MSDRSAGKAATQKADAVVCATDPKLIRNVVFVGPQGAGKTTLVEQLLVAAGALEGAGSIELGSTVCDFDEFEIQQQKSASLSVASLRLGDVKVNLIDTPGYSEFVGELRAGLRAADAALFVVSATDGIDPATIMLWEECARKVAARALNGYVMTEVGAATSFHAARLGSGPDAHMSRIARVGAHVFLVDAPRDERPSSAPDVPETRKATTLASS